MKIDKITRENKNAN